MEYRDLGRTGARVSAIGLGTEYLLNLPRLHVVSVIHEAIARGVNYFDVFMSQPEFRDNLGAAFKGHRDRVMLAAHLGSICHGNQGDVSRDPAVCERFFHDFLERYHTDYADVLMLHNCDKQEDFDQIVRPGGPLDLARRYKQQGKARFIGFSGHTAATARQAIETGEVEVLMFPINLAGNALPDRRELLDACADRSVGVVAMKPFAGGRLLAQKRRLDMGRFYYGGEETELAKSVTITPVQCLAYTLSQKAVATAVPGCKDLEQLADALVYLDATAEKKDFSAALADFEVYIRGECVYCNHCLPCPSGIDVGQTIRLLEMAERESPRRDAPSPTRKAKRQDRQDRQVDQEGGRAESQECGSGPERVGPGPELRAAYEAMPARASDCAQCGKCAERCPFGVEVVSKIERALEVFEPDRRGKLREP